jgi:hypothetical protein
MVEQPTTHTNHGVVCLFVSDLLLLLPPPPPHCMHGGVDRAFISGMSSVVVDVRCRHL